MIRAIQCRKLYDGTKNPGLDRVTVVTEGTDILDIFPSSETERLQQYHPDEVIDASDKYMIPGLIDVHTHLMMEGAGRLFEFTRADHDMGEIQLIGLQNALKALRSGVTTLRDCGSAAGISRSVKKFINRGHVLGPDIKICGAAVTRTGGHCHYMGGEADGPDAIRSLIRRQQKEGIDFVKVMATAGGTIGIAEGNTFEADEYRACVEETHRMGMKVTMHVCTYDGAKAVADLGIDGMEHCMFYNADDPEPRNDVELATKFARNKTKMDHTLSALGATLIALESKPKEAWTDFDHSEYRRISLAQEKLFKTMRFQYENGCELVVGSDSGWKHCSFDGGMGIALMLMGSNGIPLDEVLVAATSRGAEYLGVNDRVGILKKGMQADMVLLSMDPMETSEAYRHVTDVYKKGIHVSRCGDLI